eukprot:TRINITY_DN43512_c0_g1_i1.p1 TRINITY_DN43512_c0_g1~~TRINITY_DN43512_c0_g1_i1.p1  ORF type:complete len:204 (-),score=23.65 TRINITY_DN43512_c0_g1_i1:29-619(-)
MFLTEPRSVVSFGLCWSVLEKAESLQCEAYSMGGAGKWFRQLKSPLTGAVVGDYRIVLNATPSVELFVSDSLDETKAALETLLRIYRTAETGGSIAPVPGVPTAVLDAVVTDAAQRQRQRALEVVGLMPERRAPQQKAASDETACVICMDAQKAVAIVDCGHALYCYDCLSQFLARAGPRCPTCNSAVTRVISIYC